MSRCFNIYLVLALAASSYKISAAFQGDIVLTPEQQASLEATSNPSDPFAPQNAVVNRDRSLWPNGIVPYTLDSGLNSQARDAIDAAITIYASRSCIRFVPRTNQADYVRFFAGSGCFSYIGRIGGPQDISIGRGCEFDGIVLHEMFHALGRWHEQSRPDRDRFVRILDANIQSGKESNFDITNPAFVTTQGVEYDIGSIMHYGSRAFSRNGGPTILPIDTNIPETALGQRQGLSDSDLLHVRTLYCGGDGGSSSSWSSWSSLSPCSRTCNGGSRSRTRTCVGGTTCQGSNIETSQCNTQRCPVAASWGSWTSYSTCSTSCGGGRQTRSRRCVGGNTCVGTSSQFRNCNTNQCPEAATWGSWGSWSSCSRTCQGGFRQRRRTCQNGNTCPGADVENQNCNTNIPCQSTTNNGEWSSWSQCTAQCGGGERFRTRRCGGDNCDTESDSCNTQDCQPEPELRGIQYRGCWYANFQQGKIGTLEGRTRELSDNPATRLNPVSKCGIAAQIDNYRYFGVTLGYCISGSNLLSDYQYYQSRLCRDGKGSYNRGYFIMDVYEITNSVSFSDSVVSAGNITTDQNSESTTDDACRTTSSLVIMIGMLLIGYVSL